MVYMIDNEWAVHQCKDADKYIAERRQDMSRIAGNVYSTGVNRLYHGGTGLFIRYCPFCGCELDKEEIADERLPKKYIHTMWKA